MTQPQQGAGADLREQTPNAHNELAGHSKPPFRHCLILVQPILGSPVYPGLQAQKGALLMVVQSLLSPQTPSNVHTFRHLLLTHERDAGQSELSTHSILTQESLGLPVIREGQEQVG
jgi:hypothetical protein